MINLDTPLKRAAIVVFLLAAIVLIVAVLIYAFMTPQFIAYHMPNGHVMYYKRGLMENSLAGGIQLILIIFPLLAATVVLLLAYGGKLLRWISRGNEQPGQPSLKN